MEAKDQKEQPRQREVGDDQFQKGKTVFEWKSAPKRDKKVLHNPIYAASNLIEHLEEKIGEIEALETEQGTTLKNCNVQASLLMEKVNNILNAFLEPLVDPFEESTEAPKEEHDEPTRVSKQAETLKEPVFKEPVFKEPVLKLDKKQIESYYSKKKQCKDEFEALVSLISKADKILEKTKVIHKDIKDFNQKTKQQIYHSIYRDKFIPLYRKHIHKLVKLIGMPCYDTPIDQLPDPISLKEKFLELKDLAIDFLIPFGNLTNKACFCSYCKLICFVSHSTMTNKSHCHKFTLLSSIFSRKISTNDSYEKFLRTLNLLPKNKGKVEALKLPKIQLPGQKGQREKHPCFDADYTEPSIGRF